MQKSSISYGICTYGISIIEKKTNQMNIMIMLKIKIQTQQKANNINKKEQINRLLRLSQNIISIFKQDKRSNN